MYCLTQEQSNRTNEYIRRQFSFYQRIDGQVFQVRVNYALVTRSLFKQWTIVCEYATY